MEGRRGLIEAGELVDTKARINELKLLKVYLLTTLRNDETFINITIFKTGDKLEQGKMAGLMRIVKEIDSQIVILEKSL